MLIADAVCARRLRRIAVRHGAQAGLESLESRLLLAGDYSLAFTTLTLPDSVFGFSEKGTCKVNLTNDANAGFSASDKADFRVVLRPSGAPDASTDIVIGTLSNQGIGIAVGGSKSYNVALTVAAGTAVGDYAVLAFANMPSGGAELTHTSTVNPFTVDPTVLDLRATLGAGTKLPANTISGDGTSIPVQVVATNIGNIAAAKTENVTIQIVARPVAGGSDVVLLTLANQSINGLKPNSSKSFNSKVTLPTSITTQQWMIVAIVTDNGPTAENDPNNNAASSAAINVTQGFVDLGTTLGISTVPPAIVQGTTVNGTVQVKMTNVGNITTSKTDKADITLVLRPDGGGADIPLLTLSGQSISSLKGGLFKLFTAKVTLAGTLPAGVYHVVATGTDTTAGVDTNAANDVVIDPNTVTIAAAFVDLAMNGATSTESGTVVGGTKGIANVTLKNLGNVGSVGYLIEVFATENGTIPGGATPIGSVTSATAKLNPGATLLVPVNYTLPVVAVSTPTTLVVRVTLAGDTQAANDAGAAGALTVIPPPPLLGDEPTQITFTELTSIPGPPPLNYITEGGTVTYPGQPVQLDTYSYIVTSAPGQTKVATLGLGISPHGPVTMQLTFTGARPNSVNGRTITFQSSSSGATGRFDVLAAFPLAGILVPISGFFVLVMKWQWAVPL